MKKNILLKPFFSSTLLFSGAALIIIVDQFLKYKIRSSGGFYICNNGISFSLAINSLVFWVIFFSFFLFGFLCFKYLIKNGLLTPFYLLSFALITGGAVSNSIDRFYWSCVIDFLSTGHTFLPVFNPADVAIFLGSVILLLIITIKDGYAVHK